MNEKARMKLTTHNTKQRGTNHVTTNKYEYKQNYKAT